MISTADVESIVDTFNSDIRATLNFIQMLNGRVDSASIRRELRNCNDEN